MFNQVLADPSLVRLVNESKYGRSAGFGFARCSRAGYACH